MSQVVIENPTIIEENRLVNDIRRRVAMWRKGGYLGVTPTTARLIAYWTDPNREKKLFFCQNEALETAIYIAEVATARTLWVPAINNHSGFGRWAFIKVADPWDAQKIIRAAVNDD